MSLDIYCKTISKGWGNKERKQIIETTWDRLRQFGRVWDNLGRIATARALSSNNIGKNRRHIKGCWEYIRIQVKHGQKMVWSSPSQAIAWKRFK